jgi:hypothetical protein
MLVDLSNEENGVYFIRINLATRVEMVRIIKQ